MSRLGYGLLALFASLVAGPAQGATVGIVRPVGTSPALTETLYRLHGELLSIGLGVELVGRPGGSEAGDPRAGMERAAAERRLDAILDIVGDEAPVAIDIWIFERPHPRTGVSRVGLEPDAANGAERLAIRAIEVLRSSLLETRLSGQGRTEGPPETPSSVAHVVHEPSRSAERIGFEAGAAIVGGLDRVGPAILPVARVAWPALPWLGLQLELAGPGSRPVVSTDAGEAEIGQWYGLLGACYCGPAAQGLGPYLALGGGALRATVEGRADPPREGHSTRRWSFLLEGSVGARWRSSGRYYLTLAGHLQIAQPYVAVHILDAPVATIARPNLLVTLTVGAWL